MKQKRRIVQNICGLMRQARVPVYLHHFGPKKYTSLQHCKAWLLKEKFKCSWREFLTDFAPYFLDEIPDHSTLVKFVQRLPIWLKNKLIELSAGLEPAEYGAIDSTGLSRTSASKYFLKRIDRDDSIKRCVKLSLYTSKRRILAFRLRAKWRGDTKDVKYLLNHASVLAYVNCMDKGYDANWIHEEFRKRGLYSIIPVRKNCRRGKYRKEMKKYFEHILYHQRNCSEYNNSSLKRCFGSYLRSIKFRSQHSEVTARVILHNLKAILFGLFHQSLYILNLRYFKSGILPFVECM